MQRTLRFKSSELFVDIPKVGLGEIDFWKTLLT